MGKFMDAAKSITREHLSRLRIISGILQSQTGSPESRLERALLATESLMRSMEPTDAQIDNAAFRAAVQDVFGSE